MTRLGLTAFALVAGLSAVGPARAAGGPEGHRRDPAEAGRRRLGGLRPRLRGNAPQSAEADRSEQRRASSREAWSVEVGSDGKLETTPLVFNGVLYGTSTWSQVYAIDLRTRKVKWQYDPALVRGGFDAMGPRPCCGPVNRGVALYDGRVYVGLLDGRLVALDAETGAPVWAVQTTPPGTDYTITGAPRIVKGKVVIGQGGAEYGVRGFLAAYDAATGKQAWKFYVIPGDPSKPFEDEALAVRGQDLERPVVEVRRRRHAVGRHCLRPGTEPGLRRHRQRLAVERQSPQPRRRRQSVPVVDRRAQRRHRQVRLALPDDARRQLGLQRGAADDPRRPDHWRPGRARC